MSKTKMNIDDFFSNGKEIDEALQEAVRMALVQHKKAGKPHCVVERRDSSLDSA